jgi:hypothetical protein
VNKKAAPVVVLTGSRTKTNFHPQEQTKENRSAQKRATKVRPLHHQLIASTPIQTIQQYTVHTHCSKYTIFRETFERSTEGTRPEKFPSYVLVRLYDAIALQLLRQERFLHDLRDPQQGSYPLASCCSSTYTLT